MGMEDLNTGVGVEGRPPPLPERPLASLQENRTMGPGGPSRGQGTGGRGGGGAPTERGGSRRGEVEAPPLTFVRLPHPPPDAPYEPPVTLEAAPSHKVQTQTVPTFPWLPLPSVSTRSIAIGAGHRDPGFSRKISFPLCMTIL